jgi:hypothetical protein
MGKSKTDAALVTRIQKLCDEQQALYVLASRRVLSRIESQRLDELRQSLRELWQRAREHGGTNVPPVSGQITHARGHD